MLTPGQLAVIKDMNRILQSNYLMMYNEVISQNMILPNFAIPINLDRIISSN